MGLLNPNHKNIEKVDCDGNFSAVTSIPSFVGDTCEEMYMAIAPIQSAQCRVHPARRFYHKWPLIYRFTPPNPPNPLTAADIFATIPDTAAPRTIPGLRSTMWARIWQQHDRDV